MLCETKSLPPLYRVIYLWNTRTHTHTHTHKHDAEIALPLACSPSGGKVETKSKLMRQLGETIDLSSFDYQSGRHQMLNPNLSPSPSSCQPSSSSQSMVNPFQRTSIRRSIHESMGPPSPVTSGAPRYSQIWNKPKPKYKHTQKHTNSVVVWIFWWDSWYYSKPLRKKNTIQSTILAIFMLYFIAYYKYPFPPHFQTLNCDCWNTLKNLECIEIKEKLNAHCAYNLVQKFNFKSQFH